MKAMVSSNNTLSIKENLDEVKPYLKDIYTI